MSCDRCPERSHDIKKTHPVVDEVSLDFGTLGTWRAACAKAPGAFPASCFRGGLPPVDFLAVVLVLAISKVV